MDIIKLCENIADISKGHNEIMFDIIDMLQRNELRKAWLATHGLLQQLDDLGKIRNNTLIFSKLVFSLTDKNFNNIDIIKTIQYDIYRKIYKVKKIDNKYINTGEYRFIIESCYKQLTKFFPLKEEYFHDTITTN